MHSVQGKLSAKVEKQVLHAHGVLKVQIARMILRALRKEIGRISYQMCQGVIANEQLINGRMGKVVKLDGKSLKFA